MCELALASIPCKTLICHLKYLKYYPAISVQNKKHCKIKFEKKVFKIAKIPWERHLIGTLEVHNCEFGKYHEWKFRKLAELPVANSSS